MPSKASVIALSSATGGAILLICGFNNWEQSLSWHSPHTDSLQGTDTPGQVKHRNLAADRWKARLLKYFSQCSVSVNSAKVRSHPGKSIFFHFKNYKSVIAEGVRWPLTLWLWLGRRSASWCRLGVRPAAGQSAGQHRIIVSTAL